jgi:hypothetical protein
MTRTLLITLLLAGCGAKVEPQDQFDDWASLKADAFSGRMKVAGQVAYGDPALRVKYSSSPLYRAVTFDALAGDPVDIWVRSTQGDPVTWLLDPGYATVAKNDDAPGADSSDSHIAVTLKRSGTFYVVFRDYDYGAHYFNVEVRGPSGCRLELAAGGSNATVDSYARALADSGAGWSVSTRRLPACADLSDGNTRSRLREVLRGGDFLEGGTRVTASPVASGGFAFTQRIDQSLAALHRLGGPANADSLANAIKRPVISSPDAFLEVRLDVAVSWCTATGAALIDTRTGIVYLVAEGC